jgi:hypothetical protein
MDLHIGHPMSSASVCSRREPSKIAQGKRRAALGKRQTEGIRPGGADRTLAPRIAESNDSAGFSHRSSRAGIPWSNASPGVHPWLFSSLPSGKNCAECFVIPPLRTAESSPSGFSDIRGSWYAAGGWKSDLREGVKRLCGFSEWMWERAERGLWWWMEPES